MCVLAYPVGYKPIDGRNYVKFLLESQPRLAKGALDGEGASFISQSHEVEKPVGKRLSDGTTSTRWCHLPSHDPNLLLCEMGPIMPTRWSVVSWAQ